MAKIKIIGVPMDLGAGRRGVDMGPSAIRIARLGPQLAGLGHEVFDLGNISSKVVESMALDQGKNKYLLEIAATCRLLEKEVREALEEGCVPLVLGGDHSIAVGTVAGVSNYYSAQNKKIGLLWLDAHADINSPETSESGNIHGMPVAHILGKGSADLISIGNHSPMLAPDKTVLVGLRDLDGPEKDAIRARGVTAFTMRDIDEQGLSNVMRKAIEIVSTDVEGFHVSMDADWLDPSEAPGVGTPVLGGATYREGHLAMEMVADSKKMLSFEVVEVNPVLDHENQTAKIVTGIVLSAFGKKIL